MSSDLVKSDVLPTPSERFHDFFDSDVIYWHTLLQNCPNPATYGDGTLSILARGWEMDTGAVAGQEIGAMPYREWGGPARVNKKPILTWDRTRMFKTSLRIDENTAQYGYICMGEARLTRRRVGFYFENDTLYMMTCDATTENTSSIQTFGTDTHFALKAKLIPGVKAEYWVDGDYVGELTANLPSGESNAGKLVAYRVHTTEDASKYLRMSEAWFLQLED